ncbi:hypothetical protein ACQ8BX_000448 [Escherichia coli]
MIIKTLKMSARKRNG